MDVSPAAGAIALEPIPVLARRGQDNDRKELRPFVGADLLEYLDAVDLRELQVKEDHSREDGWIATCMALMCKQVIERLHAVVSNDDLVLDVVLLKGPEGEHLIFRIVLDQQNHFLLYHRASSMRVK